MSILIHSPARSDIGPYSYQRRLLLAQNGDLLAVAPVVPDEGSGVALAVWRSQDDGDTWTGLDPLDGLTVVFAGREAFGIGYLDPRADRGPGAAVDAQTGDLWLACPCNRLDSEYAVQGALVRIIRVPYSGGTWDLTARDTWETLEVAVASAPARAVIQQMARGWMMASWRNYSGGNYSLATATVGTGKALTLSSSTPARPSDVHGTLVVCPDGMVRQVYAQRVDSWDSILVRSAAAGQALAWGAEGVLTSGTQDQPSGLDRFAVAAAGAYLHLAWSSTAIGPRVYHRVLFEGAWSPRADLTPDVPSPVTEVSLAATPDGRVALVAAQAGILRRWLYEGSWGEEAVAWEESTLTYPHTRALGLGSIGILAQRSNVGTYELRFLSYEIPVPEPEGKLITGKLNRRGALYGA